MAISHATFVTLTIFQSDKGFHFSSAIFLHNLLYIDLLCFFDIQFSRERCGFPLTFIFKKLCIKEVK